MMNARQFEGLDWLRFGLACYLILFHTARSYVEGPSGLFGLLSLGNFATSCFFVLSGFLLTWVYVAVRSSAPIGRRAFLINRLSALYPLHLLTFALAFLIAFVNKAGVGAVVARVSPFSDEYRTLGGLETTFNVVNHLTLTHAWNPAYLIFNVPSWSISALLFFYLLFPFIAVRLFRVQQHVAVLLALGILFAIPGVVVTLFAWYDPIIFGVLHRNPLLRLPLFLAGIILCSMYVARVRSGQDALDWRATAGLSILLVVSLTAAGVLLAGKPVVPPAFINTGLYYLPALATVWMAAHWAGSGHPRSAYWASRLGKASLSMFALHLPLFRVLLRIEFLAVDYLPRLITGKGLAHIVPQTDYTPVPLLYPLYFLIIVAASVALQERVVDPVQAYVKRRFVRPGTAGPAVREKSPGSISTA
ncbi:acyltransferase family protein [Noviherbaspirillum aridicola]|uniref:Acyltransferase n=1 Tax=Noviherbaspirillum aridicola TaxID=2849687 RepID=A0ABQ4Q5U4_9BURK|nr:acyltransferase [Noviherbaspirillum aridicola]GIZ52498.1 acyltransferase [Noviherbaspirillum aridicola]